ncbi:MAG: hypothetical protein ACRC5A_02330 [Enterobacteriaceae bacterium]
MAVHNFRFMLPFFDVYKYPQNAIIYDSRQLFSDPVGCNRWGSRNFSTPLSIIHDITFWQNDGASCITHWVEGLWDGKNEGSVWWDGGKGDLGPAHNTQKQVGMLFNQPAGKALAVLTQPPWNEDHWGHSTALGQIQFMYEDGSRSSMAGWTRDGHPDTWLHYPGYYVSGIAWQSDDGPLQQIACVIWGFKQLMPPALPTSVVNALHKFSQRTGTFLAMKPENISIYNCGLFTRPSE